LRWVTQDDRTVLMDSPVPKSEGPGAPGYLAEEASEPIATEFISRIEARFSQLALLPLSGSPRSHLAPGLRAIFEGKYAIYYLPRDREIVVVRVLHGSRDILAIADEGGLAP
jgi:toxin ParE1/3/4